MVCLTDCATETSTILKGESQRKKVTAENQVGKLEHAAAGSEWAIQLGKPILLEELDEI